MLNNVVDRLGPSKSLFDSCLESRAYSLTRWFDYLTGHLIADFTEDAQSAWDEMIDLKLEAQQNGVLPE
jgi:hypothetical protein